MTEEINPEEQSRNDHIVFNIVYSHLPIDNMHATHKSNVSVIWTHLPIDNSQLYLYLDAYSYTGIKGSFDILLLHEPIIVLPGQYDSQVWERFDHVITQYDTFIEYNSNFSKFISPRGGFHTNEATPESAITEDPDERERSYPTEGRIKGICMINGNKQSAIPGELYSKRIETALWFASHSNIPFDVYGTPPFFLPNYKGIVPRGKRIETLKKYRFGFAFENVGHDKFALGYVDKILDCLETRTVPIYLGAPNISEYIPEGCYIDFRKFEDYGKLDRFLQAMTHKEYMEYIRNIDLFVTNGGLRPYSWNTIYDHLLSLFAERMGQAVDSLCGNPLSEWSPGMSPRYNGEPISENNSSPLWTFGELVTKWSPLVDYGQKWIKPGEHKTNQERYNHIVRLQGEGKYKEAINEFAYMGGGGNIELHYLFANLLLLAKQYDNAKIHLELIITATNGHSKAYNDLGGICLVRGEVKESVELFHKAIACDNKNYDAIENLMDILTRLDIPDYMITLMPDLMKSSPTDVRLQIIDERYGLRKSTEDILSSCMSTDTAPCGELSAKQNVYTGIMKIAEQHKEEHKMQRSTTNHRHGFTTFGEHPLVSVVCFVYNREKYIAQTIASVLNQTYPNIELVILNDGSTDSTENIINKYLPNPTIKYHYQENLSKSLGTSDIKFDILNNRSVDLSSGDFICVIGADDIYFPGRIEQQIEEFRKYPQLDISFCNALIIDEQGNYLSSTFRHPRALQFTRYNLLRWLFTINFIAHPSVMLRRTSFYEQGCYGGGFGCDWHFWLKTAGKLNFKYLDEPLWCYRIHEDSASTSSKNADMCIAGTIDVLEEFYGTRSIEDFYPEIASCTDKDQALYSAHLDFGNDMLTARFIGLPRFAVREYEAALSYKENSLETLNNLAIAHVVTGNRQGAGKIFNYLRSVAKGNDIIGHNIDVFDHSTAEQPHIADYSIITESTNVSELKQKILFFEQSSDILPGSTLSLTSRVTVEELIYAGRPEPFLNVVSMPKRSVVSGLTSIIIPVSAYDDNLKRCIQSIHTHAEEANEIILAAQDSLTVPGWMKRMLKYNSHSLTTVTVRDRGFAASCNEGLQKASGQYVLILDRNSIMLKGSIEKMRECIDTRPEHGITVPMSNHAIGIQQIPKTQQMPFRDFEEYAEKFNERNRHRYIITSEIDCTCALIERELIDTIGFFNEQIDVPYFVMNDYRMRALVEGQQAVIAADSCVYLYQGSPREKGFDKIFHEQWNAFNPHSETGRKLSPFVAMKNARDHRSKGLLDEAVQAIMEGIKYTPEEEELYYCLAEILLEEKQYEEAIEAIQSLPETGRVKAKALEILGHCSYYLGRMEEAQSYAEHALSLCFDSIKALNLKGLLALKQENQKDAEVLFQQAIAADPSFADPYVNMGVMKWHNSEQKEALDLIEKGFILSPETGDFSTTYNSAITSLKEFSRAEKVFLEACGLFPKNKKLTFLFIGILLQQEKFAEAMEETEKAMITFGADDGILAAALQIRDKIGPLKIDETHRNGSLSVCMIAKNEEKYIARCLASLTPVADEIIVVDTGSTDRTKDIARAFGAQIFDFPWTDDFSEARNVSLEKARGQWVLVHDADEVISSRDYDKLKDVIGQKTSQLVAYTLTTRTYTNNTSVEGWNLNSGEYPDEEKGAGWLPSTKTRLFRNDSRIRFQNQVHEFVEPSLAQAGVEIRHCTIPIHHYGKLDPERSSSRAEMYFELGGKKMMSFQDTKSLRELAIQAGELGKYTEALGLWDMYIKFKPDDHAAYFNMTTLYLETGEFEKALAAARIAKNINPQSKEALLGFATSSICWGDIVEAVDALEGLLKKEPGYVMAIGALAAAYCISEKTGKGITLLKEMQAKRYDCSIALHSLSKKLIAAGRSEYAKLLLESVIGSGYSTLKDSVVLLEELNTQLKT
ncbi:MAG: glycosyltransferase [Proteobacteria bacterium]|nr:glycosyltransferase [Pseudomonadota bacterium]